MRLFPKYLFSRFSNHVFLNVLICSYFSAYVAALAISILPKMGSKGTVRTQLLFNLHLPVVDCSVEAPN